MKRFQNTDELRDQLVALTNDLIHFPTHASKTESFFQVIEFISDYFQDDPVHLQTFLSGGIPSLLVTLHENRHPDVLLSGHLDVVENSVKYETEIRDGKLYGSGALDMKGGVACMMATMKHFSKLTNKPSLGLLLTCDEETGSKHGTPYLLDQEDIRANFVIVNEGRWRYDIVTQEKGIMMLKLKSYSQGAHGAYPWKAKNPIHELQEVLMSMEKLFAKPSPEWQSTFAVTTFHAGKEYNTIPDFAEAVVNIRFIGGEEWSKEAIMKKLNSVISASVDVEAALWGDVFNQNEQHPYVQRLQLVASDVLGSTVEFGHNHGASDARFFHEFGIPVVSLGPTGNYHHTNNEYVEIDSLVEHTHVLRSFIEATQNTKE